MKKINEFINKYKDNKWSHYLILALIGLVLSYGLIHIQIRDTDDGALHYLRIKGTADILSIGQFPAIMNQNYCYGYGYAINLFYPPLVTYIPLLINLFVNEFMIALKLFGALCIIASGITMYNFTYQVTKNRYIALFSGFFYMIAPYKLSNVYRRYAIGEFAAFVFIPMVFSGLYNLLNQDRKKHYYIAIGAIGLILTHTISCLYTAIFSAVYVLFYISKLKDKDVLKKLAINLIFIILISLLFTAPYIEASLSSKYSINLDEEMRTVGYFVQNKTLPLHKLFISEKDEITFIVGIPTLLLFVLTPLIIKNVGKQNDHLYIEFIIFSLISIFMASNFFPWLVMPNILCKLQFAWRMLGFFIFFSSFICGINLYNLVKQACKRDIIRFIIVSIFIILSTSYTCLIMTKYYTEDPNLDKKYCEKINQIGKISHHGINREYMPLKALKLENTYMDEREDKTYILDGNAEISKEDKQDLIDNISVKKISENTVLEFPYLYYVGYEVKVKTQDNEYKVKPIESDNGFLACKIDKEIEECTINVKYVGTTITYVSYIISSFSLIGFVGYIVYENRKNKSFT